MCTLWILTFLANASNNFFCNGANASNMEGKNWPVFTKDRLGMLSRTASYASLQKLSNMSSRI
jgi:hypothetical protein